ncbi:MAG TPA: aspartate-semialdehyde dehydrogenase [Nitrososphaerales archaeon]|nr:aspartate-semialdehyde dehydrogenase [Nitrososphaerales archaeon]
MRDSAGRRLDVAVLSATGMVGQRYVSMLSNHPFFRVATVTGQSSVGKKYGQALTAGLPISAEVQRLPVRPTSVGALGDADLVFSPLPTEAAAVLEPEFVKAGYNVITDASPHRMDRMVPLVVPEVNPTHLALVDRQKKQGWRGSLVATPNCTAAGLALVLKPIHESLGLKRVIVSTMQAVSGAGYPGVPSLDILENVIPFIKDEEDKVEKEPLKMLGDVNTGGVAPARFDISAMVHRVPTIDGHLESMYVETEDRFEPPRVAELLEGFRGEPQRMKLPTAPAEPIIVTREEARPQPRLDRYAGTVPGMSVVVGRIRKGLDPKSGRLTFISHNTIRGAAGSTILTAELMYRKGLLG